MSVVLALALSLVGMSASAAQTATCIGQEGTIGQLQIQLSGNLVLIQGGYRFKDPSDQNAPSSRVNMVKCQGQLANNGQSGISSHDYYELTNCPVHYLRTEKDQAGRLTGWISLVTRGDSQYDTSGYEYHFFICR